MRDWVWVFSIMNSLKYVRGAHRAAAAVDREALFWQSIEDSDDPAMFEAYLQQFPNGAFAQLARLKVRKLEKPKQRAPSFLGTWAGVGTQLSGESWEVKITIGEGGATIDYATITCGGKLNSTFKSPTRLEFLQELTYGAENCFDAGRIVLSLVDAKTVRFEWVHAIFGIMGAHGVLTRQ